MEIRETSAAEKNRSLPGKPTALWLDNTSETHFPALEKDLQVDTVIVGGGIAGITTAALLKDAGQRVAVIEARKIVIGVTGHSTAKITSLHGLIYQHLHSHFGEEGARMYADANQTAIETMVSLVETKRIACDFQRRSAYTYTDTEKDLDRVEKEVQIARSLGLPATYVEATSLPFAVKGAICLTDQAQFHPRKFVLHLAEELHSAGCAVFEETRALDIVEKDAVEVITDKGVIKGKKAVVASHFPFKDPAFFFARMYPKRSYVLGARIRGILPDGMFYSTSEPYVSMRSHPTAEGDILLIGGQNHKTGHVRHTSELYRAVERLARERFEVESIEYRWSTQDNVTLDRVPYIGRISPLSQHVYVATGFAGWGMAHSMVAARILSDTILGPPIPGPRSTIRSESS